MCFDLISGGSRKPSLTAQEKRREKVEGNFIIAGPWSDPYRFVSILKVERLHQHFSDSHTALRCMSGRPWDKAERRSHSDERDKKPKIGVAETQSSSLNSLFVSQLIRRTCFHTSAADMSSEWWPWSCHIFSRAKRGASQPATAQKRLSLVDQIERWQRGSHSGYSIILYREDWERCIIELQRRKASREHAPLGSDDRQLPWLI